MTVYPLPDFGLSDDMICIFDTTLFVAIDANTYWWSELTKPNDTISNIDSLSVNPLVTSSYIIHGTDSNTCYNEDTVEVWVNPQPILSTSAVPDSICLKDSAVLTTIGAQSYWWAKSDSPGDTISILSSWKTTFDSTTTMIIIGTDSNTCVNTDTLTLTINPLPALDSIIGSRFICPFDDSIDYSMANFTIGSYYDWTVTGGTLATGQGTDSIKIAWDSTGSALVTVVETNKFGCISDTIKFPVNININWTPAAPVGPDTLCWFDRDSVVYSAVFTFGANYYWHIQGGTILSGDSTWQVIVRWDSLGTGYLTFDEENVTIDTVCFNPADTLWVTLTPSPSPKLILGDFQVCVNDSAFIYTVSDTAGATYILIINGGYIAAGDSTNVITVNWDSAGTWRMSVFEINQYGCVGDTIDTIVNVYMNPTPAGIFGNIAVCAPDSLTVAYWVNGSAGSTFEWIVSGGVISGQGNDSITVDWNLPGVGTLKVVEQSADSCFSDTLELSIVLDNPILSIEVVTDEYLDDKDILIKWVIINDVHFNGSFNLLRKPKHVDSLWILIAAITKTYFEDEGLPTSMYSYDYKIVAINACGKMVASAMHNSILLLDPKDSKVPNEINLSWNNYLNWPLGVDRYEVWRMLDDEQEYTLYLSAGLDTIQTYVNATDGYHHCYRIKAYEYGDTTTSWSNELCMDFDHLINIPNAFSPNGDGVNDTWVIENIDLYPDNTLQIFNRWGNIVYNVKSYDNTYRGIRASRDPLSLGLPDGNYYYVLTINTSVENIQKVYKGSVLIMR